MRLHDSQRCRPVNKHGEPDRDSFGPMEKHVEPAQDWFSPAIKLEARRVLTASNMPADDETVGELVRSARTLAFVRGWLGQTAPKRLGMKESVARPLLDSCPDDLKRSLIAEAANPALIDEASFDKLLVELMASLEATLAKWNPNGTEWETVARKRLRHEYRKAVRDAGAVDLVDSEFVLAKVGASVRRTVPADRTRGRLQQLGDEAGLPQKVIEQAKSVTRRKAFDSATLPFTLDELLQREHRRLTDPPHESFKQGFFDKAVCDEFTTVFTWMIDQKKGERWFERCIKRVENDQERHAALGDAQLLQAKAEHKVRRHWLGLDQLDLGPKGDANTEDVGEAGVRYVKKVLLNELATWRKNYDRVTIESIDDGGPHGDDSLAGRIDSGTSTEDEAEASRGAQAPSTPFDITVAQSVELLNQIDAVLGRGGIGLAQLIGEVPDELHARTREPARQVIDYTTATVCVLRGDVASALAKLRTDELPVPDADQEATQEHLGLSETNQLVRTLHPKHRTDKDWTQLVFRAIQLLTPAWRTRYGDEIPASNSQAPGAVNGRNEGADYQEMNRRARGHEPSTTPLVRDGILGLFSQIETDCAAAIDAVAARSSDETTDDGNKS